MTQHRLLLPAKLFRAARPASANANLTKTAVQIVAVWGFALGLLPAVAGRVDNALGLPKLRWRGRRWHGAALLAVGSAAGLASARTLVVRGEGTPLPLDAARNLVVAGPYRVIRNPMVMTGLTQSAAVAVLIGSPTAMTLPIAGGVVWNRVLRPSEERFLAQRFGEPYEAYRRAVRCWVPRWPPYVP
jgi:protein-S-isoprenylcysteine O-methyltransferase Ste14